MFCEIEIQMIVYLTGTFFFSSLSLPLLSLRRSYDTVILVKMARMHAWPKGDKGMANPQIEMKKNMDHNAYLRYIIE